MKRTGIAIILIGLMMMASGAYAQESSGDTGLIPPPAIYLPEGAQILAEVNISDNDILGIIKQMIPALGETAKSVMGMRMAGPDMGSGPGMQMHMAAPFKMMTMINAEEIAAIIDGIKGVRVVIGKYPQPVDSQQFAEQFEYGMSKAGKFSRVIRVSGQEISPVPVALYAEADGGGYVGFAYNADDQMVYAARIVGFIDVAKFTEVMSKTFMSVIARGPGSAMEKPTGIANGDISVMEPGDIAEVRGHDVDDHDDYDDDDDEDDDEDGDED